MKFHVPGSLRQILSIPQRRSVDVSALPLPTVTAPIKAYRKDADEVSPSTAAVEFYCLNHLVALLQQKFHQDEPLPPWAKTIAERYAAVVIEQGRRMFSYILLIIAREARHVHANTLTAVWAKKYGTEFLTYLKSVKDLPIISATDYICDNAVEMTVGDYTDAIALIFSKGSWSGGFGGKPWMRIAECISRMVHGQTSMELMVDSAYSLAHNNGPIFNKGMLYGDYHGEPFIKVLDIQRSGQIPEMVLSNELNQYTPADLHSMVTAVNQAFPGSFKAQVDYVKVEKAGSVAKYHKEKAVAAKVVAKVPVFISGKKVVQTGTFTPYPGQHVEVLKRVA